jgi:hypothetical protein
MSEERTTGHFAEQASRSDMAIEETQVALEDGRKLVPCVREDRERLLAAKHYFKSAIRVHLVRKII